MEENDNGAELSGNREQVLPEYYDEQFHNELKL
jgi:hypothetical protein